MSACRAHATIWQRGAWGLTLFALALYAGAEFATWLAIGPMLGGLPVEAYVSAHQKLTQEFKPAMPIAGVTAAAGVLLCVVLAALEGSRARALACALGLACCSVSISVTAIHNDGINAAVAGWTASAPPREWAASREAWIAANPIRTLPLLGALVLVIGAVVTGIRPVVLERVLSREIAVAASPEIVWAVLTDLRSHRKWNSYAPEWSGTLVRGGELLILAMPGGKARQFRATVDEVLPHARLVYRAHIGSRAIMHMSHSIEIVDETVDGRARSTVIQREVIRGLLVPLIWPSFEKLAGAGFARMNDDLRRAAEARAKGASP
jgi:hypothetical protein